MGRRFDILDLTLINCSITNADDAIKLARRVGGEFFEPEQLEKGSPICRFSRQFEGTLMGAYYGHKVLCRELVELPTLEGRDPSGKLSFLFDSCTVAFSQGALGIRARQAADSEEARHLDCMARGQLALGNLLYQGAHPEHGCIDQMGDNTPNAKSVKKRELRYIFWANFWGPAYVEKYGRSFLRGAPGWKNEDLDDGGILYVATESYFQWWSKPPAEVLSYFQTQIPGVKLYRAKASPEF